MFAGGYYVYNKARTNFTDIQNSLEDYFTSGREGEISPFGRLVEQCAEVTAQRLGTTVQAAIRGSLGGTMTKMVPALEQEAIEANPELAFIDVLPKSLKKSPLALQGLQLLMNRLMANQGQAAENKGNNHKSSSQTSFTL